MASVDEPAGSVWIINPDELAKRIRDFEGLEPLDANLASVKRIESWLYASLDAQQTIGVETVLSTPKYRALVEHAKSRGFSVNLIYVFLDTVELNIERVQLRVEKGGHAVPEDRIRSRRIRSFDQFSWFFEAADAVDVYDNSGASPQLVLTKRSGSVLVYDDLPPEIVNAIEATLPGFRQVYEEEAD